MPGGAMYMKLNEPEPAAPSAAIAFQLTVYVPPASGAGILATATCGESATARSESSTTRFESALTISTLAFVTSSGPEKDRRISFGAAMMCESFAGVELTRRMWGTRLAAGTRATEPSSTLMPRTPMKAAR